MRADLLAAWRALAASKTFTVAAVAVLALGIGATSAIYSVVDAVVLRGLPFDEHDRLVAVMERHPEPDGDSLVAPQNYLDWADQQDVFESLAAVATMIPIAYEPGLEAEELRARQTTASFFDVLRIRPQLGRVYTAAEQVEGRHAVAVLGEAFWRRRYGGDPDVIGRRLRLDDTSYEIIGVLPAGVTYPVGDERPMDLYVPYVVSSSDRSRIPDQVARRLEVIGRLREGVAFGRAQARMGQIAAALRQAYPAWNADTDTRVLSLRDYTVGDRARSWLLLLLGAAGAVLTIACANVALLQLARAAHREHEMGVRMAIGGGRWRLVRQLLVENVVLALVGLAAALALATWGVDVLRSAMPPTVPRVSDIQLNRWVMAVTTGLAVLVGVLCGLAPALHLSAPRLALAAKDGTPHVAGGTSARLRHGFVAAEVAVAVTLLVGASLFTRSFLRVSATDPGFDTTNLLTANIALRYRMREDLAAQYLDLLNHLQSPAIVSAAVVMGGMPLAGSMAGTDIEVNGRRSVEGGVGMRRVSARFHETLRIPLLAGRTFAQGDYGAGRPVAVINESLARMYFPDGIAVGQVIGIHGVTHTIIGVVGDVHQRNREVPPRPEVDVPLVPGGAGPRSLAQVVVRTSGDPYAALPAVTRAVHAVLPDAPLRGVRTVDELLARQVAQRQFNMFLLGLFGILGAAIATVGVFGAVAYGVERRTREIGVRVALGATPQAVMRLVTGETTRFVVAGLVAGTGLAWGMGAAVRGFLFGIDARDSTALVSAVAAMAMAAFIASLVPARRAARVDPSVALRVE